MTDQRVWSSVWDVHDSGHSAQCIECVRCRLHGGLDAVRACVCVRASHVCVARGVCELIYEVYSAVSCAIECDGVVVLVNVFARAGAHVSNYTHTHTAPPNKLHI